MITCSVNSVSPWKKKNISFYPHLQLTVALQTSDVVDMRGTALVKNGWNFHLRCDCGILTHWCSEFTTILIIFLSSHLDGTKLCEQNHQSNVVLIQCCLMFSLNFFRSFLDLPPVSGSVTIWFPWRGWATFNVLIPSSPMACYRLGAASCFFFFSGKPATLAEQNKKKWQIQTKWSRLSGFYMKNLNI